MDPFSTQSDSRQRSAARAWLWRLAAVAAIIAAVLFLGTWVTGDGSAALAGGSTSADGKSEGGEGASEMGASGSAQLSDSFGRCWNEEIEVLGTDGDWGDEVFREGGGPWAGGEAVPCSDTHTTYTFAVENIPRQLHLDQLASGSATADAATRSQITDAAYGICDTAFSELIPTTYHQQVRVDWFWFSPSDDDWNAGARWVRCDIAMLQTGTPLDDPQLALLPASVHELAEQVTANPRHYGLCVNAPGSDSSAAPRSVDQATLADCTDNPRWEVRGSKPLPSASTSEFRPDVDTLMSEAQQVCHKIPELKGTPATLPGWIYAPTEADWERGWRSATCWSTYR
ncbi:MAG: hypothetical protein JWQ43_2025 [Glaciihabitans sp.]|nr:hypothetical protein [Glaciihabitans sp.]